MSFEILIVRQTGDGTATVTPADFQSESTDAVRGFVEGFNEGELEDGKGVWAVVKNRSQQQR